MANSTVSAQELARKAGETYDTIDLWSGRGLLCFERRGRKRLNDTAANLSRIKRIRALQNKGHSLEAIRGSLATEK